MLNITNTLLIALLGSAFIGVIVGWIGRRIVAIRQNNKLVTQSKNRLQLVNDEVKALRDEEDRMESELAKTKAMVSAYEKAAGESVKQASEFSTNMKRKDQKLGELESQVLASEEQHMRVQRDFAKLRLTKTREVQQLRQQLSDRVADAGGVEIQLGSEEVEDDLPVLQKKPGLEESVASADEEKPTELTDLYDLSSEILDSDEDVLDMTSEFDFEAAESLLHAKEKVKAEID